MWTMHCYNMRTASYAMEYKGTTVIAAYNCSSINIIINYYGRSSSCCNIFTFQLNVLQSPHQNETFQQGHGD